MVLHFGRDHFTGQVFDDVTCQINRLSRIRAETNRTVLELPSKKLATLPYASSKRTVARRDNKWVPRWIFE
jgi:hypothetical protein